MSYCRFGPDASAAILIGRWSMFAPEVGDKAGKRVICKSMAAWQGGAR